MGLSGCIGPGRDCREFTSCPQRAHGCHLDWGLSETPTSIWKHSFTDSFLKTSCVQKPLWACSSQGTILDKKPLLCYKRPSICDSRIQPCSVAVSPPGSSWHSTHPPSLSACGLGGRRCSGYPHALAGFKSPFSSHPIDSLNSLTPSPTFLCPLRQLEVTCADCHLEP